MNNLLINALEDVTVNGPFVGYFAKPDGWNIGANLLPGDMFVDSGYAGSQYKLPTNHPAGLQQHVAIDLKVTGRSIQYDCGRAKIRVEFIAKGDCEPDHSMGCGWLYLRRN